MLSILFWAQEKRVSWPEIIFNLFYSILIVFVNYLENSLINGSIEIFQIFK